MNQLDGKILALCGGVGGAKLALGLSHCLAPEQLEIVVNTGDDFRHLGLSISPDLDTVTYTLAGLSHPQRGWGLGDESWTCLEQIKILGGDSWFALGDRDIALHLCRSEWLRGGQSLSEVTRKMCSALGISHPVVPMSDDSIRTMLQTQSGDILPFQDYFVRLQCEPAVSAISFAGAEAANPSPEFNAVLSDPNLAGVLICPSNPLLSIGPILAIPGVRDRLKTMHCPIVAVSPFVGGQALKGPAAKIFRELGLEVSNETLVSCYEDFVDCVIADESDREITPVAHNKIRFMPTIMENLHSKIELASSCVKLIRELNTTRQI